MVETVNGNGGLEGYTLIHGKLSAGPTRKMVAHLHAVGPNDDGVALPRSFVEMAAEHTTDLILTPHNSPRGVERAARHKERERHNNFELVPGYEYAAVDKESRQPRHVIILGIDSMLPPALSEAEANREAHRRGAFTVAAHPGLGKYSTSIDSIRKLSKDPDPEIGYDAVEIYNPAIDQALAYARKIGRWPVIGCMGERIGLPQYDLNAATQRFMQEEAEELGLAFFAGSDAHCIRNAADVVLVRPESIPPIEAIASGQINIFVREQLVPVTVFDFAKIRASNTLGRALYFFGGR